MRSAPAISTIDWRDTPAEVAARWPLHQPLLWLHSGRVHPRWARWSILASPRGVWRFENDRSRWIGEAPSELAAVRFTHNPLTDLDAVLRATALDTSVLTPAATPFRGGWIGYFSYDLGRVIEPRAQHAPVHLAEAAWPLIELAWCPDALVFDHVHDRWTCVGGRIDLAEYAHSGEFHLGEIEPTIAPQQYQAMVARTIEYIAAGDIFQANIAQRFRADFEGSTRALARTAFESAQPWYGAYLESGNLPSPSLCCEGEGPGVRVRTQQTRRFLRDAAQPDRSHPHPDPLPPAQAAGGRGSRALLSLSPELFLQTNPLTRRVVTRPIKGTRPTACDARELRDSLKDEAELNMIVDLMRNDLGRVCEFASVRVPNPRVIETHPTVHHGVAEISGRLRQGISAGDLLGATFPPGSVTGAPKIRAMQIIDELETASLGSRGPYCGAIGFISDCGAITLNVAIRTLMLAGRPDESRRDVLHQGDMHYWSGAGIVAESTPARELQETLDKAAVLRQIGRVPESAASAI